MMHGQKNIKLYAID